MSHTTSKSKNPKREESTVSGRKSLFKFYCLQTCNTVLSCDVAIVDAQAVADAAHADRVFDGIAEHLRNLPERSFAPPRWQMVETYETVYANLLAGKCLLLSPMKYPVYPDEWYHPVRMSAPVSDTYLLTLRDDPHPEITHLKQIFQQVYREFFKDII